MKEGERSLPVTPRRGVRSHGNRGLPCPLLLCHLDFPPAVCGLSQFSNFVAKFTREHLLYCFVLYLSIYIALLTVQNNRETQRAILRERERLTSLQGGACQRRGVGSKVLSQ